MKFRNFACTMLSTIGLLQYSSLEAMRLFAKLKPLLSALSQTENTPQPTLSPLDKYMKHVQHVATEKGEHICYNPLAEIYKDPKALENAIEGYENLFGFDAYYWYYRYHDKQKDFEYWARLRDSSEAERSGLWMIAFSGFLQNAPKEVSEPAYKALKKAEEKCDTSASVDFTDGGHTQCRISRDFNTKKHSFKCNLDELDEYISKKHQN